MEVAAQLARCGPGAYRVVKREINRQYERPDKMSMVESLVGNESREGMAAFMEKRPPAWIPEDLRVHGRL
jgi:enoyl-CoA hydratase/carnithine racemase